jgi:hypothetical protein
MHLNSSASSQGALARIGVSSVFFIYVKPHEFHRLTRKEKQYVQYSLGWDRHGFSLLSSRLDGVIKRQLGAHGNEGELQEVARRYVSKEGI